MATVVSSQSRGAGNISGLTSWHTQCSGERGTVITVTAIKSKDSFNDDLSDPIAWLVRPFP